MLWCGAASVCLMPWRGVFTLMIFLMIAWRKISFTKIDFLFIEIVLLFFAFSLIFEVSISFKNVAALFHHKSWFQSGLVSSKTKFLNTLEPYLDICCTFRQSEHWKIISRSLSPHSDWRPGRSRHSVGHLTILIFVIEMRRRIRWI